MDLLIIDTETTGLGGDARVVEVVAVDGAGAVRLHALVDPGCPIPAEATAVHGITDAMVAGRPGLADLWPELAGLMAGRVVVAYNERYDRRVLAGEAARLGLPWPACEWRCAMEYARRRFGLARPVNLAEACRRAGVAHEARHRALGDATATLALVRALEGVPA